MISSLYLAVLDGVNVDRHDLGSFSQKREFRGKFLREFRIPPLER
jgi:hypothetical protein